MEKPVTSLMPDVPEDAGDDTPFRPPPHRFDRIFYGWEYVLPMAVFLIGVQIGSSWKNLYAVSYVLRTFAAAALLIAFWKRYTPIRWTHLGLGVVVGVVGVIQWVGMEKLLMTQPWLSWTRLSGNIRAEAFHPYDHFRSAGLLYGFLAVRWLGSALVVPVMEELFWRDFVWRSVASPNDFRLVPVGIFDKLAVLIVPGVFALVHVQWLTAIVWALLIAWLLLKTRSLGACVVAHGVTNFLLGAWVLYSHHVRGVDEWYFW
jgi:uncharacterized protein